MLRKYAKPAPPPSLMEALGRWETNGREASLSAPVGAAFSSPEALQHCAKARPRAVGDALGPVSVVVRPGGIEKVRAALARLGYLSDVEELLK